MLNSLLVATLLLAQASDQSAAPAGAAPSSAPALGSAALSGAPKIGRLVPFAERKLVPYETSKGFILFKLTVAGQEGWALFDTGAQITVIDEAFAQARELKVETSESRVETYQGGSALRVVKDVSVVMPGQFETRAPALAVMDLKDVSEGVGRKIDFVFGHDYLRNMVIMFNPQTATVQFGPSGGVRAPESVPFIPLRNGKLEVEAIIGGQPVLLGLDTGSQFPFSLTPEAWARLGPSAGSLDGQATTDKRGRDVKVADVADIQIGPARASKVKVLIRPGLPGATVDGTIGAPFFDGKMVVIDEMLGKVWVVPPRPRPPAP